MVAGLKGHIAKDALQGSMAVAILNLKPAKLAGEASEAMLLAADAPAEGGGELVRTLVPPGNNAPSRSHALGNIVTWRTTIGNEGVAACSSACTLMCDCLHGMQFVYSWLL